MYFFFREVKSLIAPNIGAEIATIKKEIDVPIPQNKSEGLWKTNDPNLTLSMLKI